LTGVIGFDDDEEEAAALPGAPQAEIRAVVSTAAAAPDRTLEVRNALR